MRFLTLCKFKILWIFAISFKKFFFYEHVIWKMCPKIFVVSFFKLTDVIPQSAISTSSSDPVSAKLHIDKFGLKPEREEKRWRAFVVFSVDCLTFKKKWYYLLKLSIKRLWLKMLSSSIWELFFLSIQRTSNAKIKRYVEIWWHLQPDYYSNLF